MTRETDATARPRTDSQVHRAVTLDGQSVAVKVQHPDVARHMSADIRSMSAACRILEGLTSLGVLPPTKFDMLSLMREYEKQVPLEMDFAREGRVQSLVARNMREDPPAALMIELEGAGMPWGGSTGGSALVVPQVVGRLSRRRVLTSVLLDGRSVHSVPAPFPDANGCVLSLLNALGKQIFIDGVFHSDPHPGNLLLLSTGRLALVDFGQSKELTPANMLRAASVIVAVASRSDEAILKACRAAGLRARATSPKHIVASAYILFDTRMDIPEARPSPALLKLGQSVWVSTFPQELFMVMRVVTILRGLIARQGLSLSAAQAREPSSRAVLCCVEPRAARRPPGLRAGAEQWHCLHWVSERCLRSAPQVWRPYAQMTLRKNARSLDAAVAGAKTAIAGGRSAAEEAHDQAPGIVEHRTV